MIPQDILDRLVKDVGSHVYSILCNRFSYEGMSKEDADFIAIMIEHEFREILVKHFDRTKKSSEN